MLPQQLGYPKILECLLRSDVFLADLSMYLSRLLLLLLVTKVTYIDVHPVLQKLASYRRPLHSGKSTAQYLSFVVNCRFF